MAYLLINLELIQDSADNNILSGWIAAKTEYKEFIVDRKGNIKYYQTMDKGDFTSFDHFVGVMGKFDPHSIFFDPKEVNALNFITLLPFI